LDCIVKMGERPAKGLREGKEENLTRRTRNHAKKKGDLVRVRGRNRKKNRGERALDDLLGKGIANRGKEAGVQASERGHSGRSGMPSGG